MGWTKWAFWMGGGVLLSGLLLPAQAQFFPAKPQPPQRPIPVLQPPPGNFESVSYTHLDVYKRQAADAA